MGVQNTADSAFQVQLQERSCQFFLQCFFLLPGYLCGCYQIDKKIPGGGGSTHNQMPQIPLVAASMIERKCEAPAYIKHSLQNFLKIIVDNTAVFHGNNIIIAVLPVHSQCQRTAHVFIAKGKLHFIAVSEDGRTWLNTFELFLRHQSLQQFFHLVFLQFQLVFVRKLTVHTSAAASEMAAVRFNFTGCLFKNLQRPRFRSAGAYLQNTAADTLSRDRIFYVNRPAGSRKMRCPPRRKADIFNAAFNYITLFHTSRSSGRFCFCIHCRKRAAALRSGKMQQPRSCTLS